MQVNSYSKVCHALNMAISALKAYKAPDSDTDRFKEFVAYLESALHTPRRNCDVGTAEEQVERWNNESLNPYEWGDRQYLDAQEVLEWAQMPYEEGGDK